MNNKLSYSLTVLLSMMYIAFAYLSVNMLLPALPILNHKLLTTDANIKLSVTALLFGYALAQFLWAILAERFGQKRIICGATIVVIIGCVLAANAEHIALFMTGRLIEGIGSGFGPVLARMLIKKNLSTHQAHTAFTYLVSTSSLMPVIAPFIGAQVLHHFDWQAILYLLAGFGVVVILITQLSLRTLNSEMPSKITFLQILSDFKSTLTNRAYMAFFMSYILVGGMLITYYVIAPYIFIKTLHIATTKYSLYLIFVGLCYLISANIHGRLLKIFKPIIHITIGFILLFMVILELCFYNYIGHINIVSVVFAGCLLAAACGFISPTANVEAITSVKGRLSIPVSLLGSGMMLSSSVILAVLALFTYANLFDLTILFSIIFVLAVVCFYGLLGFKQVR